MKRILAIMFLLGVVLAAGCGEDVTKPEPVVVRLSPDSAAVETNESLWFRATVLNTSDTTVTWYVDGKVCGDSISGTISTEGRYTAPGQLTKLWIPPDPMLVEVTAVSNADPTRSATAEVTITESQLTIQVSPAEIELKPAGTQEFLAEVENASDPSVVWSLDPIPGVSDPGILYSTGHYQAPEPILDNATLVVRATSVEDSTRSGTALVHLLPFPIVVTLSPDTARVGEGQLLEMPFSIENTSNTNATWYVNGMPGGSTSVGIIQQPGQYWAPSAVPPTPWIEIRVVSEKDTTKTATCQVEIVPEVKIECEDMTDFQDRGGVRTIYEVFKSNASSQYAIEGLDKNLEWIEIPVELDYSGNYKVTFRNATRSATDIKISILDPEKRQGPEWILTVEGGGCG
jgi:hypothetical protein